MTTDTNAALLLKDILDANALAVIADAGTGTSRRFDRSAFIDAALPGLGALSLMERVRHIADALKHALPDDYAAAADIVRAMAPRLTHGFQAVAAAEFIARYGFADFDRSIEALADLTRFGSAEFAIRAFLAQDADRTLAVMTRWSESDDEHLRRLASEGSRPRLPWAGRVPALKADPTLAMPILERLKADPSLYVRKSVANHLNDIAKDRPDWLLDRLTDWPKDDPRTVWIIHHGLRTLIKKGDPRALAMVGAAQETAIVVRRFSVAPQAVVLGDAITITAELASDSSHSQRLVVDYRVHYVRAGGKTAAKVFKLKTFDLAAGEATVLSLRQKIQDFTTRRHYAGRHVVELIVNGRRVAQDGFDILLDRVA